MASILVVDDSYIMRMKIKAMLSNVGHTVVCEAANGEQAIMEYTQKKPDIVTMDISMPVMDGILALKQILLRFPQAKIIVISALDKKNMVLTALESGAKNYILKPVDESKLLKTIEAVLKDDKPTKLFRTEEKNEPFPGQSFNLESEVKKPFSIDNRNGTFVINLTRTLNTDNFSILGNAIQGFLFVKPLRLIFNFGDMDAIGDDLLERLRKLISAVKVVGGVTEFSAENRDMKGYITRSIPGVQFVSTE